MPLHVYRCEDGHETERLQKHPTATHPCETCGKEAERVMGAHSTKRDGTYSWRKR